MLVTFILPPSLSLFCLPLCSFPVLSYSPSPPKALGRNRYFLRKMAYCLSHWQGTAVCLQLSSVARKLFWNVALPVPGPTPQLSYKGSPAACTHTGTRLDVPSATWSRSSRRSPFSLWPCCLQVNQSCALGTVARVSLQWSLPLGWESGLGGETLSLGAQFPVGFGAGVSRLGF